MRIKALISLSLFFALFFNVQNAAAVSSEPFDAREIARLSQERYVGDDSSTALTMKLINARGEIRPREFLRYQIETDSGKITLLKFLKPADIKDTGTLNVEIKGKDDLQHLYLPAAKKLRRVSAKNQSWVGSDFSYEDLQEIEVDDYRYEAVGAEVLDGFDCYVYTMEPLESDNSVYGKQVRWVTKGTYVPIKIEYYEKNGRLLKTTYASDIRGIEGAQYAWHVVCENAQDGHRTELDRIWIVLNQNLGEGIFTTRHLEKSIEFYDQPKNIWNLWKTAASSEPA